MYLKPASVVNRVYLSLFYIQLQTCQAAFPFCERTARRKLVLVSSPPAPAGQQHSAPDPATGAAQGLGTAAPLPRAELHGRNPLSADASGVKIK